MVGRLRRRLNQVLTPLISQGHSCNSYDAAPALRADGTLRLLTFNIQVGISTSSYRQYVTKSWQHFLPHKNRNQNLDKIAGLLQYYDIVALQEVDGGSLRSGFVNQVEYLAKAGGFPCWHQQLNRNFGMLAKHSNGLLSRYQPLEVKEYRLPGLIPGRGAIVAKYGRVDEPVVLVIMHLSLSDSAQRRQLDFIHDLIAGYKHVVLMGDMNTHVDKILRQSALKSLDLVSLPGVSHSFPSWRPEKALDHILISRSLNVKKAGVISFPVSDHLPIALEVALPEGY